MYINSGMLSLISSELDTRLQFQTVEIFTAMLSDAVWITGYTDTIQVNRPTHCDDLKCWDGERRGYALSECGT